MNNSFINELKSTAQSNQNPNGVSQVRAIYMKVDEIKAEQNDHYAYGIDLISKQNIRVRLSTIQESANDMISLGKSKNLNEAINKVTNIYTGRNARQTLQRKRDKHHTSFLFFDRCYPIDGNFIPTFRAHWSNSMSQQQDVEMVTGMMNIQYRERRQVGNKVEKTRAWVQAIEFSKYFEIGNIETNYKMLDFALRNRNKAAIREGNFVAEIESDDGLVMSFNIFQRYAEASGTDFDGNPITYLTPQDSQTSLQHFFKEETGPANSFLVTKDVARVVLDVFCGINIDTNSFASQDPAYISKLNSLKHSLESGEYRVRVFGMRIYRFGPETLLRLAPTGSFNPIKTYSKPQLDHQNQPTGSVLQMFLPTILLLHKTQNDRRYIAFHNRIHYDIKGEGAPRELNQINGDIDGYALKTFTPLHLN